MHDVLNNGVGFRTFNVIDDFNREGLNITVGTSITSKRVIRELEKLIEWRGKPDCLRVDNGLEIIANTLELLTEANTIELKFIPKGKNQRMAMLNDLIAVIGKWSWTIICLITSNKVKY